MTNIVPSQRVGGPLTTPQDNQFRAARQRHEQAAQRLNAARVNLQAAEREAARTQAELDRYLTS